MRSDVILVLLFMCLLVNGKKTVILTQHDMCSAKTTCEYCLRLTQCAWCNAREKGPRCFPSRMKDYVKCEELLEYIDKGLSLAENVECVCHGEEATEEPQTGCVPPGAPEGTDVCSARGSCKCGRCSCATFEHDPSKMVTGHYCECDNFSCEGRDCSEGPYCLNGTAPLLLQPPPPAPDSAEGIF